MKLYPPTIVLRHRKENLKKCSLRGLEIREDFLFFTYPKDPIPFTENYIILDINAPLLSKEDQNKGLFILDGTWRYAQKMYENTPVIHSYEKRSLPTNIQTAYPRRQEDCPDPSKGLASIEAIYIAYLLMERNTDGLLDNYVWRDKFFQINEFNN